MNLTLIPAPEHAHATLTEHLSRVVTHSHLGAQRLGGKTVDALGPIPLYVGDVALSGAMTRPRRVGWRYLLVEGDAPVAVADLKQLTRGRLALCNIHYETGAAHLYDSLLQAESLEGSARQVRVLLYPRLHTHAVWLFGRPSFYVLSSASGPGAPVTHAEMHEHLLNQHRATMRRRKLTN